jgi:hypothetical protein
MAHNHVQSLKKHPHPAPKDKTDRNTHHQRHIKSGAQGPTTPTTLWKVTREEEQEEEARLGVEKEDHVIQVDMAYEGPGVLDPQTDGPIAHPA